MNLASMRLLAGLILMMISSFASADLLDSMEKALMPGDLAKAHAKYEEDCKVCHEFFSKTDQNKLCLKCHDHKNIADDIKAGKGMHGRLPGIDKKKCKVCHAEHKGADYDLMALDKQTFDHRYTDFVLRDSHVKVACESCHKRDKKYHEAGSKCVDCHKKQDPHKGKLGKKCDACHRESAWQDFQYDHAGTKFPLKFKHKGVQCRDCHPQEKYTGVPKKCFSCHEADDKHKGKNGKKCKDCHSEKGWSLHGFNHDKKTKFPLKGKHKQVHCDQCHRQPAKKKKLSKKCYSCHRFGDSHKGLYGKKCKNCHNAKSWKKHKFNHDKTDFKLRGKHKKVSCNSCHTGHVYKEELETKCLSCHKPDDVHKGKQGKECDECHNAAGWQKKVVFDHNLIKFPLLGAHAALACEECHTSSKFRDAKMKCYACHRKDDEHKKRMGVFCQRCHFSTDWKVWEFDHDDQSDYPLKGAHKGINCELCHKDEVEEDLTISSVCFRCHAEDDTHDGQFGRQCVRCHNEKSFAEVNIR